MKDRFDLEDDISKMLNTSEEIDDIIYRFGDCPDQPSEDQMLNMLIGVKELFETRYKRMWDTFEGLVKDGTIQNRNKDKQCT